MPVTIMVSAEEEAMADAQPKVLNLASTITSSSIFKVSFSASPQAREPTSPRPLGFYISPTL